MFLAISLMSIILLFSFVNSLEEIDNQITTHAVKEQETQEEEKEIIKEPIPQKTLKNNLEGEVYTSFAWGMFYIIIWAILAFLAILTIVLKNTISKNIKQEESESF